MKTCFAIGLGLVLLPAALRAADYPLAFSLMTVNQTNSFTITGTATSATAQTNEVAFASYHTFHAVVASTNASTFALDRSLDGHSWVVVGTNTFTTPGGTGEQVMAGKWNYARYRVYGSNTTATVYYLGARQ